MTRHRMEPRSPGPLAINKNSRQYSIYIYFTIMHMNNVCFFKVSFKFHCNIIRWILTNKKTASWLCNTIYRVNFFFQPEKSSLCCKIDLSELESNQERIFYNLSTRSIWYRFLFWKASVTASLQVKLFII